jgi:hypothetical protein
MKVYQFQRHGRTVHQTTFANFCLIAMPHRPRKGAVYQTKHIRLVILGRATNDLKVELASTAKTAIAEIDFRATHVCDGARASDDVAERSWNN